MNFGETRYAGAQLLDTTVRSQDLREEVNAWLVAEGLIRNNKRASHQYRAGLEEFFVGLVANGGSFSLDTRNNASWTYDYGSRQYLVLLDRMSELGYFSGTPITGETLSLTSRASVLKSILSQFIDG